MGTAREHIRICLAFQNQSASAGSKLDSVMNCVLLKFHPLAKDGKKVTSHRDG